MLHELVTGAQRFRADGEELGGSVKLKRPRWIIDCERGEPPRLEGPHRLGEWRPIVAPDRQRSGVVSPSNLKPYLLMDKGQYALGAGPRGRATDLAHESFTRLVNQAYAATASADIGLVAAALRHPAIADIRTAVDGNDMVTFRVLPDRFPAESSEAQAFWNAYLSDLLAAREQGDCSVCGHHAPLLRTLPSLVTIMGQTCSMASFNAAAYCSFGKEQTRNLPICYACGTDATQSLAFLVRDRRHHAVIARGGTNNRPDPARDQLAVYWLRSPPPVAVDGEVLDLESALAALLNDEPAAIGTTPPPALAQLEALVKLPWRVSATATQLDTAGFYLAILSVNKIRLVVREWLQLPIDRLRDHLAVYLQGLRVVGPNGEPARPFSIYALVATAETADSLLVRGLIETAFMGVPPPRALAQRLADRLRDRTLRENPSAGGAWQALMALVKLALTYGTEEARQMEELDPNNRRQAYHCGRLLAVLEETQRRASRGQINATVVDRYYAAASTTPAITFGYLVKQAEVAHLPKVRRENRGYTRLQTSLQEVFSHFDRVDGLPQILLPDQQAEFALGYYHQRAELRREGSRQPVVPAEE